MEDGWFTLLTVIVLVSAALGGLVLLRVLALFREQMIAPHDHAREAGRVRMEHINREQSRQQTEEDMIVA